MDVVIIVTFSVSLLPCPRVKEVVFVLYLEGMPSLLQSLIF